MKVLYLLESVFKFLGYLLKLIFHNNKNTARIQFKRLKRLIQYSWDNIPAYRKLWEEHGFTPSMFKSIEDLKLLPVIDKNFVRENSRSMCSVSYNPDKLTTVTTGGTTGMPMRFLIDNYNARAKELAYQIWGNWHYFGHIQGVDRVVTRRGYLVNNQLIDQHIFWEQNNRENGIYMSSFHILEENYEIYLSKLRNYKPKYIKAYPSSIVALCSLMRNHGDKGIPCLKGVICSSENVYDWQRVLIRDVLGVEIYSYYGHSEKSVCAFQTHQFTYEFPPLYGFVEFLDSGFNSVKESEVGRVVVTSFDNHYFPFIRYNTDDYVQVGGCTSGNKCALKIIGREQEFVFDEYGNKVIFTCSDEPLWGIDGILAYQYVQNVPGLLNLNLMVSEYFNCTSIQQILEKAKIIFVNFRVEVNIVDDISRTNSGKFRYLVQNINYA